MVCYLHLLLLPAGLPGWRLLIGNFLPCLGLLTDPITSTWLCPLCSDSVGLGPVRESTACAGVAFSSCLRRSEDQIVQLVPSHSHLHPLSHLFRLCAGSGITVRTVRHQPSTWRQRLWKPELLFSISCSCNRQSHSLKLFVPSATLWIFPPPDSRIASEASEPALACGLLRSCCNGGTRAQLFPAFGRGFNL